MRLDLRQVEPIGIEQDVVVHVGFLGLTCSRPPKRGILLRLLGDATRLSLFVSMVFQKLGCRLVKNETPELLRVTVLKILLAGAQQQLFRVGKQH